MEVALITAIKCNLLFICLFSISFRGIDLPVRKDKEINSKPFSECLISVRNEK